MQKQQYSKIDVFQMPVHEIRQQQLCTVSALKVPILNPQFLIMLNFTLLLTKKQTIANS